jgi:hypothetical protein
MRSIRYGLLAGGLAGLLLVGLLFYDEGPSNQLIFVAQSFGLDGHGASRGAAALLLLILGTIIGGLFGALLRQPSISRGKALLCGLVAGVLWWAILYLLLGVVVQRLAFPLYLLMLYLVVSLVYGLALSSVFVSLREGRKGIFNDTNLA